MSAKVRGARKEEKSPRGRLPIYPFLVRLVSLLRLSSLPDCLPSPAYRVPAWPDKFRSLNLKCLATSARDRSETLSARNGRGDFPSSALSFSIQRNSSQRKSSVSRLGKFVLFSPRDRISIFLLVGETNPSSENIRIANARSDRIAGKAANTGEQPFVYLPAHRRFISLSFEQIPGTSRG